MGNVIPLARGELAPWPNTFVQPGYNGASGSDLAMTDGVPNRMLKAQQEQEAPVRRKLISPAAVKRHLRVHHGRSSVGNPLAVHAQQHVLGQMIQGHTVGGGGQLMHTGYDASSDNFASEAPPQVFEFVGGVRQVETPGGEMHYHEPVGSVISSTTHPETDAAQDIAAKLWYSQHSSGNDAAADAAAKASHAASLASPGSDTQHQYLLSARQLARQAYPAGHPERVKIERDVRSSQKSRRSGDPSEKGFQPKPRRSPIASENDRTKAAEAAKDRAFYTPDKKLPQSIRYVTTNSRQDVEDRATRDAELSLLNENQQKRYAMLKLQGISHDRAIGIVRRSPQQRKGTSPGYRPPARGRGR